MKRALSLGLLALATACTQYSTDSLAINPVMLLGSDGQGGGYQGFVGIERIVGGGHILRVAAQNSEVIFQGYRIYEGTSEAAVQAMSADAGTACSAFVNYPLLGVVYTMEASTAPKLTSTNLLCAFPVDLTTGRYVSIRAVYLTALGQPPQTSMPSNALLVP